MYKYVFESMLALDSCVVIATIKNPKISRKILRFFRSNSRVVLQEIALNEASRILEISKEKIGSVLKKEGDLKRIVFKPNRRIDDFV
jgi:hypothetical protein